MPGITSAGMLSLFAIGTACTDCGLLGGALALLREDDVDFKVMAATVCHCMDGDVVWPLLFLEFVRQWACGANYVCRVKLSMTMM